MIASIELEAYLSMSWDTRNVEALNVVIRIVYDLLGTGSIVIPGVCWYWVRTFNAKNVPVRITRFISDFGLR